MNRLKESVLKQILAAEKSVELAFIFGSEAAGRSMPDSDVDIALLLRSSPLPQRRLDLRLRISGKLSKVFGREVDVTILNGAGSILKHQVARNGRLIFERRKGAAKTFILNTVKEYFDYLPTFNFHYERLKRRNAHG